jgi:signal transduction histidine kinase
MTSESEQTGPAMTFGSPLVERLTATAPTTLEEALRRIDLLAAALRKAESDLSTFVYKVSHDLKAPLRAIRTYAEFLLEDHAEAVSGEARTWLERLQVNADSVSEQLLGLLELSRIGRWCKPWEAVDVGQVARQVREQNEARLKARGLVCEVAGDLPVVEGERQRIVQLLDILLDNAIVYRPPDRPGRIRVESGPPPDEGQTPTLVVRDDGIGIDARSRDRVFWVFERLHPRDYPGIGMGLTLARRIVEYHRGRIWLDEEPGGGTAVHVSFGKDEDGTAPAGDPGLPEGPAVR